jgi:Zn-dependent protease
VDCFFIVIVGWIFSVCLHEYGHAIVAYHGGDTTVGEKGYLSLNPLNYGHPVLSIVLPVVYLLMGGIGLPGGAVYIEEWRIRSRAWLAATSLAGPAMNVLVALALLIPLRGNLIPDPESIFGGSLAFLFDLQISAILFNLIPIPSLDGFNVIKPFLPVNVREWCRANANIIFFAFLGIFIMNRYVQQTFQVVVLVICAASGVSPDRIFIGYAHFRFWDQ